MAVLCAIAAILIWSSLATLGVSLAGIPPFLLIGSALFIGGLLSLPWARQWNWRWSTIGIGCYGMLLYHLLFIQALRSAPPVSANLVHYLWPMLIVLLSPLVLRGTRLRAMHIACAVMGFAGVVLAITGGGTVGTVAWNRGYAFALGAAVVWSTYSLALKRMGSATTADVGLACLLSGGMALVLHAALEPSVPLQASQIAGIVALGIGPMGVAFYLWSFSLRHGDPRVIGVLANATPVLSTAMLVATGKDTLSGALVGSALLISAASLLVLRSEKSDMRSRAAASSRGDETAL